MDDTLRICPKCGEIDAQQDYKCYYCQHETVQTDIEVGGNFLNLYLEIKGIQLERELQRLHRKYVYPSPDFDEALFNKRQSKFDKDQAGIEANYQKSTTISCPKCNSTQIQMVARKWSLLTGIFTNKVDRVCVNCKHKF